MSKLPPLPEPKELGMDFDEGWDGVRAYGYTTNQMQAYAIASTEPLLQRIAELEKECDRLETYWNRCLADCKNIAELERQLEEVRKQALEEAAKVCDDIAADLCAWKDRDGAEIAISARDAIRAMQKAQPTVQRLPADDTEGGAV